jgi:hypothetical protein
MLNLGEAYDEADFASIGIDFATAKMPRISRIQLVL